MKLICHIREEGVERSMKGSFNLRTKEARGVELKSFYRCLS